MILYLMPGACPLASHIALAWADADYTVHRLSRETVRGKAYRQINPKAVVPALFLDDGNVLTESLAILEYLAEKYPKARMGVQPDDVEGRSISTRRSPSSSATCIWRGRRSWCPSAM